MPAPPGGRFVDFSDAQWQAAFELTMMSSVRMIRAVIPHMKNGGAIVTITSSTIIEPIDRLVLSTAMRPACRLVKHWPTTGGIGYPRQQRGARPLRHRPVKQLDEGTAKRLNITFDEARRRSVDRIPLKRLARSTNWDGRGVSALAGRSYITGGMLRLDGGQIRSI